MENKNFMNNLISGYISGWISITAFAPLDYTRTRMNMGKSIYNNNSVYFLHTLKNTYKNEGYIGYYKGFSGSLLGVPLFHSLFISQYYFYKKLNFTNSKYLNDTISSMISGITCQILTNPIWVARVRMQSNDLHNIKTRGYIFKEMYSIYKSEGVKGIMKGTLASLIGVTHAIFYMPLYDYFIRKIEMAKNRKVNSIEILLVSNFSKLTASFISYPHVVLRSRIQDFRGLKHQNLYYENNKSNNYLNYKNTFKMIYKKEGIKGFYAGFKVDIIKILPTNTVLMLFWEYFRNILNSNYH